MKNTKMLNWLITLEVVLIILAFLASTVPIQDYALREYRTWWSTRTPEAWKAFEDKKREEFDVHTATGSGFALAATILGFIIVRKRRETRSARESRASEAR